MRYTFFSFCYDDVLSFRANVVRNSYITKYGKDKFIDGSIWEDAKTKSPTKIKELIDNSGIKNTSVTAVLIGDHTANRRWINYEIVKSFEQGNGILGIYINRIKDKTGHITHKGLNPLDRLALHVSDDGKTISFYELKDGKWRQFYDLPTINNKKSNTLFFEDGWFNSDFGKTFRFSELFQTYCWVNDNGYNNISQWIEEAAEQAGR
ncbi:MAG: TIR domain-containing protein [Bacteroidales bacterium]|nr:TIR domain-containing protein [Bacteroidales bacterium]